MKLGTTVPRVEQRSPRGGSAFAGAAAGPAAAQKSKRFSLALQAAAKRLDGRGPGSKAEQQEPRRRGRAAAPERKATASGSPTRSGSSSADIREKLFGTSVASAGGFVPIQGWQREPAGNVITFGKHNGRSYDEMVEIDPLYCEWCMRAADEPDTGDRMREFAEWLTKDGRIKPRTIPNSTGLANVLPFGKYRGKSYEDVLDEHPEYCEWAAKTAAMPDATSGLLEFVAWLNKSAPASQMTAWKEQAKAIEVGENVVAFGKYRGRAFEDVLLEDPDYCRWVVDADKVEDRSEVLHSFASWLGARIKPAPPPLHTDILNFGKHTGRTFAEVFSEDYDYCRWVAKTAMSQDVSKMSPSTKPFIEWLRLTSPSLFKAEE